MASKHASSTILIMLFQWFFRRTRRLPSWRRKNGRRWVVNL